MALVACESVQVISIVCVAWVLSISGTFLVSFKWRLKEVCLIFLSNISDITGNDLVFPKKKKHTSEIFFRNLNFSILLNFPAKYESNGNLQQ